MFSQPVEIHTVAQFIMGDSGSKALHCAGELWYFQILMTISTKPKRPVIKRKPRTEKGVKRSHRRGELKRASAPAVSARGSLITKAPVAIGDPHPAYTR